MNDNLLELLKELLLALVIIAGGYYLKVAKDKEPHASKNLWKIVIIVGILGIIVSLVKYIIKM